MCIVCSFSCNYLAKRKRIQKIRIFVNNKVIIFLFCFLPSQSLHKDSFGFCEQQWERCVCPQQYTPHLSGGGQPHHGLWRHFASALCCHLFHCEYWCVWLCVYLSSSVCRWWPKLFIQWPFPITLDYSLLPLNVVSLFLCRLDGLHDSLLLSHYWPV